LPDQHDFAVMNYEQYKEMIGETVKEMNQVRRKISQITQFP